MITDYDPETVIIVSKFQESIKVSLIEVSVE
jgi:hypothetical protein